MRSRLRLSLALAALIAVASCDRVAFVKAPPARYRAVTSAIVVTHPGQAIPAVCAGASSVGEGRGRVVACSLGPIVHLPNPCEWSDPYAQVMCHELAHVQGWGPTHEE